MSEKQRIACFQAFIINVSLHGVIFEILLFIFENILILFRTFLEIKNFYWHKTISRSILWFQREMGDICIWLICANAELVERPGRISRRVGGFLNTALQRHIQITQLQRSFVQRRGNLSYKNLPPPAALEGQKFLDGIALSRYRTTTKLTHHKRKQNLTKS